MKTRLAPKTALATLAAVGLLLPFGTPLPGSCMRTVGVAGAAPSPSCSSDLRECLRASADMHTTTFGGRYVPADDVAKCMEAFRSCTSGGASRGSGGSPKSTSEGGDGRKSLPQHFAVKATGNGDVEYDCRLDGDSVNCTLKLLTSFGGLDSWSATFEGRRAGLTVSGSLTGKQTWHSTTDPSCGYEQDFTGPAKYVFGTDGTVAISEGPFQNQSIGTGSCSGSSSYSSGLSESEGTWSPK